MRPRRLCLASQQRPHLCHRRGEPSSRRTRPGTRDARGGCAGTVSGGGRGTAAVALLCEPLGGGVCAPRRPTAPAAKPPSAWRHRRLTHLPLPSPLPPPLLACCHPPGRAAATPTTTCGRAAVASPRGHASRCQADTGSCRGTHGWHADPTPPVPPPDPTVCHAPPTGDLGSGKSLYCHENCIVIAGIRSQNHRLSQSMSDRLHDTVLMFAGLLLHGKHRKKTIQ